MKTEKLKILSTVFGALIGKVIKENVKLGAAAAPKYVNQLKDDVVYKKVGELNSWYTRILGLDEVRQYQDRVIALQERLLNVQEKRRSVGTQLMEIRRKSNDLQEQIHKIKRSDDLQRFLDLMKEETEVLKLEHEMGTTFNEHDREEREIFTAYTNAVRDSYEKQRAQLEYTKYFGIILSVVGSFLTFCYTTFKKHDLKLFIEHQLTTIPINTQLQNTQKQLQNNNEQLNAVIKYVNDELRKQKQQVSNEIGKMFYGQSPQTREAVINQQMPAELTAKLFVYGGLAILGCLVLRGLFG